MKTIAKLTMVPCVVLVGAGMMLGAVQRLPEDVEKHVTLGRSVAEMGDLDRAVKQFEQALEKSPKSKQLLFTVGGMYQKLGEFEKAEAIYKRVVEYYPGDADGHVCLGNVYLGRKEFELAAREYRVATEADRSSAVAFRNLGFAELRSGAPFSAVKSLDQAVKLDPTNALVHFDLGMAYAAVTKQAEAQKEFRAGLAIEPSIEGKLAYTDMLRQYAGPRVADGRAAMASNNFVEAEKILAVVTKEFPDYALAYAYLGHACHHQQPSKPQEAEAAYRKALDALAYTMLTRVDHTVVLDNLGMIRMNMGDYEEAEALVLRGVSLDTEYPVVYFSYGLLSARKKAYETAAVAFADAIRRDPQMLTYVGHHAALDEFRKTSMYTNLLHSVKKEK